MTTQTRREFLGRLGWMAVGSLIIPFVPKVFHSIPKEIHVEFITSETVFRFYSISKDGRQEHIPLSRPKFLKSRNHIISPFANIPAR